MKPFAKGKHPCRVCGKKPPGRRRTFCSPECVHEWKLETDEIYRRRQVYRRDRGVCASCGVDTKTVSLRAARARWNLPKSRRSKWDCDHKVPLKLGGTNSMNNMQSLCYLCHKDKTLNEDVPAIVAARKEKGRRKANPKRTVKRRPQKRVQGRL